jgi:hypothetical protein
MALVKYNNNSISAITTTGIPSGSLVPIKTLTASSSETLSFVHGTDGVVLDSTYPIYKFEFINIHPATNDIQFQFNLSTDGGSNYNVTKTTTFFRAYHADSGIGGVLEYRTANDLAQSTSFQALAIDLDNISDASSAGSMSLYNPTSTTYVKHFIGRMTSHSSGSYSYDLFTAGYGNTTSAINAVQFKMSSGNIDDGKIKLYGIKDS